MFSNHCDTCLRRYLPRPDLVMSGARFAIFLSIVLGIWAVMHAYVFWRAASVPWVASHLCRRSLLLIAISLWASYPLARILDSWSARPVTWPIEFVAACWIGVLFLLVAALLLVDVLTLGGWILQRFLPTIRGGAIIIAFGLALTGVLQALRPPVVREHEVKLPGLPLERDGLVLVQISDLHLGNLLGSKWLSRLADQVNELRPDMIVAVGDVVDGNIRRVEPMVPILKRFRAPLGTWAVTGNHEFYAGLDLSVQLLSESGFTVLRDCSVEIAPGLVLAGVDDLTAREQMGFNNGAVETALANRPSGATILLSHSPMEVDRAVSAGAGLVLSGHTHNGQIWPFNYLVKLRYPLVAGRYAVSGATVIVCRGTGTWGPRMRLWRPGEIVRITLRAA